MIRPLTVLLLVLLLVPMSTHAMTRPVFSVIAQTLNNSAIRWFGYDQGASIGNTVTTNTKRTPVVGIGTVGNLYVSLSGPPGAGTSYIFTLYQNAVATAVTCTITGATATTCSDTVDTITIAAGDDLEWQTNVSGSPTTRTGSISTMYVSSSAPDTTLSGGVSAGANCSTAQYYGPNGGTASSSPAGHSIVPTAFTLDGLFYRIESAPAAATSYTITVLKNDVPTSLQATTTNAGGLTASDLTHSVSFAAGDYIGMQCTATGGGTGRMHAWGFRLVPVIEGESPVFASRSNSTTVLSSSNRFVAVTGTIANSTTVAAATSTVPVAFDLKKLYTEIGPAQAASHDWNFFNQKNSVSGALTATILSGATTANDTTHTVSYAIGDSINWLSNPTVGSSVLTYAGISAVTYIAPTPSGSTVHAQIFLLGQGLLNGFGYAL